MLQIMVVEDERAVRTLMCDVLSDGGYQPVPAGDGLEALGILERRHIDLIVLDAMLPRMDGFRFTETLRAAGDQTPILMVTALQSIESKKKGFQGGADDYLVKPVEEEELLLRVAALLRRAKISSERRLALGSTELNYDSLQVTVGGVPTELPAKEFQLLFLLLSYNNRIFTRQQLMDEVWGPDSESDEHTVNVHIGRLRERFKDNRDFEIVTVRGLGYKAVRL